MYTKSAGLLHTISYLPLVVCTECLVLFVQASRDLSLRFLLPPQGNGGEWGLLCDSHNIKK